MELELSLFRPVYSSKVKLYFFYSLGTNISQIVRFEGVSQIQIKIINFVKDFLEVISQVHSPNQNIQGARGMGQPFGLIQVHINLSI